MGVKIKELVEPVAKEVDVEFFAKKAIAIDAYNILYQFLATIRQKDGTPLMDAQGNITSHLNGLFYRTINFVEVGIKPVYVFDGKPPELKQKELERRLQVKVQAEQKYKEAIERGDLEEARVYAQQTSRLSTSMVEDAKLLLQYMGIPYINAPSEGEAQAAHLAKKGDAWATGSQDFDSLLFGSPRLVRNLGVTGKRKLPRKDVYVEVKPEIIELEQLLKTHGITHEQLIVIGILVGTDYAPEGAKDIGVKKALKLVKELRDPDKIFKSIEWQSDVPPQEILKLFQNPPVTDNYTLTWRQPDKEKIISLLVDKHQFSLDRVTNALDRLEKAYNTHFRQQSLETWFGF
uniref:Flap endonuclease 1 n=1 Tax=Thermofilum adornatum TaxID=1365176 RepID=A0A7C1CF34_9CREN